jgi:hypothetical protein
MPKPAVRVIRYERLVVPHEHMGVLIEPVAGDIHAALSAPPRDAPLLDTTLGKLRAALAARLELKRPVIATGHQPEFYHAGVFAKTVAAHTLAQVHGGQAVSLLVDSDVPKTARLVVPQQTAHGLRRVEVAIPECDLSQPYEAQPRVTRAAWLQCFASVASLYEFNDQSLLPVYARAWLTTEDAAPEYCTAYTGAQVATEADLGVGGVRVLRMSQLCATPEFRVFAAYLLRNAQRVAEAYNAALAAYRRRHRVRAHGRPVPPLVVADGRVEVPLWVERAGEPRRRLFVAPTDNGLGLFAGEVPIPGLQLSDLESVATHARPWEFERAGWQFRPRALTLSAFARLLLADLFVHGIGGAKYDEIMEDFITALLGVPPGPACGVSATACLPLPHANIRAADISAALRRSRDLRCNPQRHLQNLPAELVRERAEFVRRATQLRATQPHDHAARYLAFQALRRLNEQMLAADPWRAAEYDQHAQTLETRWQTDRVARDREYFYALHPRETLQKLVAAVQASIGR